MRLHHISRLSQRTLFTLPNFSPWAASETQTYTEQKVLPYAPLYSDINDAFHNFPRSYTRQQLYQVVADVKSYPRFVPYCTGSRILRTIPTSNDQVVMDAELTVGFFTFKESYVSKVTCTPFISVEVRARPSPPITHLTRRFVLGCCIVLHATLQDPVDDVAVRTSLASTYETSPIQRTRQSTGTFHNVQSHSGQARSRVRFRKPHSRVGLSRVLWPGIKVDGQGVRGTVFGGLWP